jgi:hypothetical protein
LLFHHAALSSFLSSLPVLPCQAGLLLLVHGEVTDSHVDFFDREKVFIESKLKPLLDAVRGRWLACGAACSGCVVTQQQTTRQLVFCRLCAVCASGVLCGSPTGAGSWRQHSFCW